MFAQTSSDVFQNVSILSESGMVTVNFDLQAKNPTDSFLVELKIQARNGSFWNIQTLQGDFGKIIQGKNKHITWLAAQDGVIIDENVTVLLQAKQVIHINKTKHLIQSAVAPGWGDYKARNGKFHVLYSILAYGTSATAIYLNREAINYYTDYQNSNQYEERKRKFAQAIQSKHLSFVAAGIATLAWTVDLVLLNHKLNKLKKDISTSTYYHEQAEKIIQYKVPNYYINTKSPFDIAMEKGDALFQENRLQESLVQFQLAKELSFENENQADLKIAMVSKQIAWIEAQNKNYEAHLTNGIAYINSEKYEEAKGEYELALTIKPDESLPKEKLVEIAKSIETRDRKLAFDSQVKNADALFASKAFDKAKSAYENALTIDKSEYVVNQIKACEQFIVIAQQKELDLKTDSVLLIAQKLIDKSNFTDAISKIEEALQLNPESIKATELHTLCEERIQKIQEAENDKNYTAFITKADVAWDKKEYNKAKNLYQDALAIKPHETYASVQLQKINTLLSNQNYVETNFNANPVKPEIVAKSDVDLNIPTTSGENKSTFAVIIGNEDYSNEIKVKYALNDASIFKEYLEKTIRIPKDNFYFVQNGTYGQILGALKWINDVIEVHKGNVKVIFYYAGHGVPDVSTKSAYILPVDGNSQNTETAIKLSEVYDKLTDTEYPANSVTVFLDACFSGASRESNETMLAQGRGVKIKSKNELLKGNLVVFSAATGDETAFPFTEKQHGMFTYFLLKKLQETKGNVTLSDLQNYISTNVTQQSVVINKKKQTPQVIPSGAFSENWKAIKLK